MVVFVGACGSGDTARQGEREEVVMGTADRIQVLIIDVF